MNKKKISTNTEKNNTETFFAVILCLIVLILLGICIEVFVLQRGQTLRKHDLQALSIINTNPFILELTTAVDSTGAAFEHFIPNEGQDKLLFVRGVVSDYDGCSDVYDKSRWKLTLFRSSVDGGNACVSNRANCIQAPTSGLTFDECTSLADKTVQFVWAVPFPSVANSTDADSENYEADNWSAHLIVKDTMTPPMDMTTHFEVASVRALNITPLVDYGKIDDGDVSSEQKILIENTGNLPIGVMIRGEKDVMCSSGATIPLSNIHYSLTPNFDFNTANTVSSSDFVLPFVIQPKYLKNTARELYIKIKIPTGKKSDSCAGSILFTAVKPT